MAFGGVNHEVLAESWAVICTLHVGGWLGRPGWLPPVAVGS